MIITYLDLLNKIANKEINPYNYIVVYNDTSYSYNGLAFVDVNKRPLVQRLSQSESALINLTVVLYKLEDISNTKSKEDNTIRRAKKDIIEELWNKYLELDWDISVTQGCIDDLDKQYEKVYIYQRLLEYMGVCVEKDKNKKFDIWYKEQIEKQEKAEEHKNKQLEPLGINWMQLAQYEDTEIKPILKLYTELAHRLNDVLTYLRNKDNKEKEKDK